MQSNCWRGEKLRLSKQRLIDGGDYIREKGAAGLQPRRAKQGNVSDSVAADGNQMERKKKKLV